jgi:hypothetical protein
MLLLTALLILVGVIGGWALQRRRVRQQQRLLLHHLRQWVNTLPSDEELSPAEGSQDADLQRWVSTLSADEAAVLLKLLKGFFASLNWEMNWLFSAHLSKSPALKAAVEAGVVAYMRAIFASLQLVEDAQAYKAYLEMAKKPGARRHRSRIRQIYAELVAQKIIKPAAKKRGLFSGKGVTPKSQIAAVLEAFETHPAAAMRALQARLASEANADIEKLVGRSAGVALGNDAPTSYLGVVDPYSKRVRAAT